jgi:hypothetical protein
MMACVSRRSLLRGLGAGTALLAPFLRYRSSWAQPAKSGNLLIFFTPNGHLRSQFGATQAASGTGLALLPSLAPLQPFANDIAIVKGLCSKTPTVIASHEDICRILTCCNVPGGQKMETQTTRFTGYGPSIDQSIGMAINQRPLVVAVDPYRDQPHWRTSLSWRAASVNEPFVKDFSKIFADVFGGMAASQTPAQMAALQRTQQRNQSILDLVKGDISTFRARVNATDRVHLDTYLDSLRSVEQQVAATQNTAACNASTLQSRTAALPAAPVQSDDKSPDGVVAQMQARGELHLDMIATAFACGTRRVAVVQWQGASEGYDTGADTGSPNHHSVSHYGFGQSSAARWAAIDLWYAQRFAYALNALKTLGVLDRTIVVWVSEITEGHNQNNMVTVLAGGQSLGMKMGQYIQYPLVGNEVDGIAAIPLGQNPKNRGLCDLWVTVQQAMGVPQNTFGDPQWCTGPLTELR